MQSAAHAFNCAHTIDEVISCALPALQSLQLCILPSLWQFCCPYEADTGSRPLAQRQGSTAQSVVRPCDAPHYVEEGKLVLKHPYSMLNRTTTPGHMPVLVIAMGPRVGERRRR